MIFYLFLYPSFSGHDALGDLLKPTVNVQSQAPVMPPHTGSKLLANDLDSSLANLVGSESLSLAPLLVFLCAFRYLLVHKSLTLKLHWCYSTEQRSSSHMVLCVCVLDRDELNPA